MITYLDDAFGDMSIFAVLLSLEVLLTLQESSVASRMTVQPVPLLMIRPMWSASAVQKTKGQCYDTKGAQTVRATYSCHAGQTVAILLITTWMAWISVGWKQKYNKIKHSLGL